MLVVHAPAKKKHPVISMHAESNFKGVYHIQRNAKRAWLNGTDIKLKQFLFGPQHYHHMNHCMLSMNFDDRVRKTTARVEIHEVRPVGFLTPWRVNNIEACHCVTTGPHTLGQNPSSREEFEHLEALAWQVTHVEDISFHMIPVVL